MILPNLNVDELLSDALRSFEGSAVWASDCNTYEDEHGFWVEGAVPGMDRSDIDLTLEDNLLTIKGQQGGTSAASTVLHARDGFRAVHAVVPVSRQCRSQQGRRIL